MLGRPFERLTFSPSNAAVASAGIPGLSPQACLNPGRSGQNSGSPPLNQSTGYPISFANTRLPRLTGSRSFHSRNLRRHTGRFKRDRRSSRQGLYVRFCAWRYRRSRRRDDCGRRCPPAHPTAFSIRNAIFRAAGAVVQPAGMAGYRSHLPEVDGAAP